jgi:hypothetical protein
MHFYEPTSDRAGQSSWQLFVPSFRRQLFNSPKPSTGFFWRDLRRAGRSNSNNRNGKVKIQQRQPKGVTRKSLPESLPTSVQKSYFMLTDAEGNVLNIGLQKYRPGRSEPILIGDEKLLKPALRLMSDYRLRIDEIKGSEVVTRYTRWLESVEVRGPENQEIYRTFSPQFERIWLESKKHLPEYLAEKPANIGLRSQYSLRLYAWAKKYFSNGKKRGFPAYLATDSDGATLIEIQSQQSKK